MQLQFSLVVELENSEHRNPRRHEVFMLVGYISLCLFSETPASHCDWEATGWRSLTGMSSRALLWKRGSFSFASNQRELHTREGRLASALLRNGFRDSKTDQ